MANEHYEEEFYKRGKNKDYFNFLPMKHYDIILFENLHSASNHKIDLLLIAKMLKYQGWNVGILDIYKEDKGNDMDGIPIIHLKSIINKNIPDDRWQKSPKNKLNSLYCLIRFLWQQHFYMKAVRSEIVPMADMFYCGSYNMNMTSAFLTLNKPCFYWGLRSSRMSCFKEHLKENFVTALHSLRLKKLFINNAYQCLFVSNEIIRKEHYRIGVPYDRMVIREERCIGNLGEPSLEFQTQNLSFLVIGQLRVEKRVDKIIKSFKAADIANSQLRLIGKSYRGYEETIKGAIGTDTRIVRDNRFLNYEDFLDNYKKSHFLILGDRQQLSSVTNGTMLEALINYRPIIAPNYPPYSDYVNRYKIGLLYDDSNWDSLSQAMQMAAKLGSAYFIPDIKEFLKTITFEKVSKDVSESLKSIIDSHNNCSSYVM